ncbi:hypothetical protein [Geodermatophilus sp. CPCC 206100]|uniref:hypothetical protein n=1 Tax=Geodermatophilus sp. CPCC 206100 TaxID=3020054 RepID=UPI003B003FA6
MTESLAVAACGLLLLAAAFQLALTAGAPWAAAAYGGRAARSDGRLPGRYRAASLVAAVVLVGIGWLLLLRGGVVGSASESPALTVACWGLAVLFAVNTAGNLAGRHPLERWGMGGLTACLTVLCVLLALG